MSDNSPSPNQAAPVLASRSARAVMRAQLRQNLQESRAGLRREREVSAAAAAIRAPRWRSARHLPQSGAADGETADPARDEQDQSLTAQHPAAPDEMGVTPEPNANPKADNGISQAAGTIFAGLMGDLARGQQNASNEGATDESLDGHDASIAAPGLSEGSAAAPATFSVSESEVALPSNNHTPVNTITALGPGMQARLRLLGYCQIADLADANPIALRHGLGDISRLLNVEGWIAEAKRIACRDNPTIL